MMTDHRPQLRRMRQSGLATDTTMLTCAKLWDLSERDARREHRKLMRDYALEATSIDILGELQLKYRQQDFLIDAMARDLKKEGQPASFFNVYRLTINDSTRTLQLIADHRNETGRNCFRTHEQKAQDKKDAIT